MEDDTKNFTQKMNDHNICISTPFYSFETKLKNVIKKTL